MRVKCFADLRRQKVGDVIKDAGRPLKSLLGSTISHSSIQVTTAADRTAMARRSVSAHRVPSRVASREGRERAARPDCFSDHGQLPRWSRIAYRAQPHRAARLAEPDNVPLKCHLRLHGQRAR
jgi:hypothetical protein